MDTVGFQPPADKIEIRFIELADILASGKGLIALNTVIHSHVLLLEQRLYDLDAVFLQKYSGIGTNAQLLESGHHQNLIDIHIPGPADMAKQIGYPVKYPGLPSSKNLQFAGLMQD